MIIREKHNSTDQKEQKTHKECKAHEKHKEKKSYDEQKGHKKPCFNVCFIVVQLSETW